MNTNLVHGKKNECIVDETYIKPCPPDDYELITLSISVKTFVY